MSFRKNDNNFFATVGKATALTAALPAAGAVVTPANLPVGAVVVTDLGLRRLNAAGLTAADRFLVVQGNGASKPLLKSGAITKASATVTASKFVARKQQITTIGYNGTTGSLPTANNTSYFIKIRKNDNDAANRSQPSSLFAQFVTDASGTQEELAFGLASVGTKNMSLQPANNYLKFEVLSDGTPTALAANAGVVNGSKLVTVVAHGLVAGALVNLAGATYKIADVVNANSFNLTTVYQGATATITAGTTIATEAASLAGATKFGIRLTGIQADFDVNAFRDFYVNRFTATFSDEDILITHVQGASEGNGAWERVAMDEYMTYGFEGQNEMMSVPPRPRDTTVVTGAEYGVLQISSRDTSDGLVSVDPFKGTVLIYAELVTSALTTTLAAGEAVNIIGALATPAIVPGDLDA